MPGKNELFVLCNHSSGEDIILSVGAQRFRSISLTPNEALKLAYRLMSLARGDETQGLEMLIRGD